MGYILPITNWTYLQYHLRTLTKETKNYAVIRASTVATILFNDVLEKKMNQNKKPIKKKDSAKKEKQDAPESKGNTMNTWI